ncbi:hypothetical protein CF115_18755 [Aeromonas veronii]|uniref:tetratricopeptide repeat protein n=1 Tax=Aeromonas veronii TaxID=654 RepID=UPI0011165803|nr:tetratricopeptide repeat protein [Aeromonas veronii]TNJ03450.1 hypothetical protein CF115_18755 [Aeromonas veronii]
MSEQSAEISTLIEKAEQGDAQARFQLGLKYSNGEEVQQNYEEAAKWYRKAAEQENAAAQNNLGIAYEKGLGVQQNDEEAVKWYHKAAEHELTVAQRNLGLMYRNGRGVPQDDQEALKWFKKAAEQENPVAQNDIGWMYQNGRGVPKNNKEAAIWYRRAAKQGHAIAQCNLAWMYKNGQGVIKSDKEAIKWFNKSAENDNTRALFNLGLIYSNSGSKYKNYNKAIDFFKRVTNDSEYGSKAIEQIDKIERITFSEEITDLRKQLLLKLTIDTKKQSTMTHYTSLSVGHKILQEKSPLRLGHLNAVNDPNEGKLLWRTLGHEPIEANPIFIGCFLPDSDSLNMWRFYSKNHLNDDACGCAITFNIADFFDYHLLEQPKDAIETVDNKTGISQSNKDEYLEESAAFYRVIYIGEDGHPINDTKNELRQLINKLKVAVNTFLGDSPTNDRYQVLAKLLGPLPYLLKDADYKDEQEHRIIITHLGYGAEEIKAIDPDLEKNTPPKLYLELHRSNHLKPINYVTLGPKAPYKEMMAPYWLHQLAIKFRRELDGRTKEIEKFHIRISRCAYK